MKKPTAQTVRLLNQSSRFLPLHEVLFTNKIVIWFPHND